MAEASRTSEARRDAVFGRWVVFSPARSRRPTDLKSHAPTNPSPGDGDAPRPSCPFCLGREPECAPEIFRVPAPDTPGEAPSPWRIRVIENLFPALRRDAEPPAPEEEPADVGECAVRGFGFHDVVIETPRHDVRLWDLDAEGVRDVLLAYARRVQQLSEHRAVKYVQALDLGSLLKSMLQKLCKQLNDPPFNYMVHSAPFGIASSCLPYTHWFLQIVPQLSVIGGFEMGSGCYINPVFPEDAAKILREIDCSI